MSNASDQRIRHVAIVLQSLDASTSRGLLAQLPPEQSKRVRLAMVQMGTVTPKEREAAFQSMQGLLQAANGRSRSDHPSSRSPSSPSQASMSSTGDLSAASLSPAAALLASRRTASDDQLEISSEAIHSAPTPFDENYATSFASLGRQDGQWQHMPAEALAEILQGERPIVIATVLNQVSVELATAISQALPLPVAAATLASLPHLHLTDAAILRDIQSELERKIGQYQAPKQANAEGLAKLQAIVASMPSSQQSNWTSAIAQSNPVLAAKLGWNVTTAIPRPSLANPLSSQPISMPTPFAARDATRVPAPDATSLAPLQADSVGRAAQDDIFDESMILPFVQNLPNAGVSEEPDLKQNVAPKLESEKAQGQPLEELLLYSDRDFVAVLHACQPQTVLLALSGAAKPFVARVERLMPAKDAKRLRERLKNLGPVQLREIDAAQSLIVETARKMIAQGTVAVTASVSFTAAA